MIPCDCCGKLMKGICDPCIRKRCYECGGFSLIDEARRKMSKDALRNLKNSGLIGDGYFFHEAA